MNTEQKRAWRCRCGNDVLTATVTHPVMVNVDVKFELGTLICPKCRRVPVLVEAVLDRQAKSPSIIIPR